MGPLSWLITALIFWSALCFNSLSQWKRNSRAKNIPTGKKKMCREFWQKLQFFFNLYWQFHSIFEKYNRTWLHQFTPQVYSYLMDCPLLYGILTLMQNFKLWMMLSKFLKMIYSPDFLLQKDIKLHIFIGQSNLWSLFTSGEISLM